MEGERFNNGARAWLLFDPVRNAYHRLDQRAYEKITQWREEPADAFLARINAQRGDDTQGQGQHETEEVSEDELKDFVTFLYAQKLVITPPGGDSERFAAQEFAAAPTLSQTLIHKYLFFKIPLIRPDRFLAATYPYLAWIFSRPTRLAVLIIGALGFYFAGRQWEEFLTTFLHFFTFEGLIYYGLTLAGLKVLHEFGHAYTAHHFGTRVPVMGLAFLVMFPILYTDTTNAWELTDRRKRVLIDSAGMITELAIAALALFAWSFLPDGPMRSAAFFTATTSWVLSLMVNLNPMMRFDGYYILSDMFGMPNLQHKGFEVGRWHMRKTLFGLNSGGPDMALTHTQKLGLIIYAYCTWIYRFFLFIGIAILVHALFTKALGIILFCVEIGWFIVKPIFKELKTWWSLRMQIISRPRARATLSLTALALVVSFMPWQSTITAPAIIRPALHSVIYPQQPGKISDILFEEGETVFKGQALVVLTSEALDMERKLAQGQLDLIEAQLARRSADKTDLADSFVLLQARKRERSRLAGLNAQREALIIRAPFAGVMSDLPRGIHVGRYISDTQNIGRLIALERYEIIAYPSEGKARRIRRDEAITFIADDVTSPAISARLISVAPTNSAVLSDDILSSEYRGPIAVSETPEGKAQPQSAIIKIIAAPDAPPNVRQARRGVVKIKARGEAPIAGLMRAVTRVLIREVDF